VITPRWLRTEDDYDKSLSCLANDLLGEAFSVARVIGISHDKASVVDACWQRLLYTQHLFFGLEAAVGLRVAGRIPFVYNGSAWNPPVPGGFTDAQDPACPLPSEILNSLRSMCYSARDGDFMVSRVQKAVTFVAWRDGFTSALEYLLDLIDFGYVPAGAGYCIGDLLTCLAAVRAAGGKGERKVSRRWALSRIPGIESIDTGETWRSAEFHEWSGREPLTAAEVYDERLIGHLLSLVEQTRASADLTEFIMNQVRVARALDAFASLEKSDIKEKDITAPLAMRAISAQLEEIRADAHVFLHAASDNRRPPTGGTILGVGTALLHFAHHGSGDMPSFRSRMEDQRLLGPRALGRIPVDGWKDLPSDWSQLDYRAVYPLIAHARDKDGLLTAALKGASAPLGKRVEDSDIAAWKHSLNDLIATEDREERLEKAAVQERAYPWSASFKQELAIALDEAGRTQESLPYAQASVFLSPEWDHFWQSLSVILARCQRRAESRVAYGIGRYLDDYRRKEMEKARQVAQGEEEPRSSEEESQEV
jgi:hypothetical protein